MADLSKPEAVCYSYRHAAHRQVVHSAEIGDVRDAVATGRVAELLNCTIDDLLKGLPPDQVPFVRAELEQGLAAIASAEAPKPETEPRPPAKRTAPAAPQPLGKFDPRLTTLQGKHAGTPAVIIASGPSLETPEARAGLDHLTLLRAEFDTPLVIGVNRARAVYPRCDYLTLMDHRLYTEKIPDHAGWSHLFEGWESRMFVQDLADWPRGDFIRVKPLPEQRGFSLDLRRGFHRGFTTTLLAMQVAAWLGCDPIYLAGLDLKHAGDKTHFFGVSPWNKDRDGLVGGAGLFTEMRKTFDAVAPLLMARNVRIYNLNPDSAVRCFPFATWDEALTPQGGVVATSELTVAMET